jgi:hypothetical protein
MYDFHFQHRNSRMFPVKNLEHDSGCTLVCANYCYPKGSPSPSHITTDGQSASSSWCLAPFGASDQMLSNYFLYFSCRVPSLDERTGP